MDKKLRGFQYKIFPSLAFGILAGVLFGSFVMASPDVLTYSALALLFLFIVLVLSPRKIGHVVLMAVLFGSAFCAGALHYYYQVLMQEVDNFHELVSEEVEFQGLVVTDPENRGTTLQYVAEVEEICADDVCVESSEPVKILVRGDDFDPVSYGDIVSVAARLDIPENFITDTGREFDYVNYLAKDSIFYIGAFAEQEIVSSGNGRALLQTLFAVKRAFMEKLVEHIDNPERSLANGLLLGVRESLGDDIEQDFIDTGTIHVVVLSGYNVTIVAESIVRFLGVLAIPITASVWVGIGAIFLFALIVGAGATVVRASIMAIVALVARVAGVSYAIDRALLLAAVAMVLENPAILVFDISFQLSFLATCGLIYVAPKIEYWFMWLPSRFGIRELVTASVATQIAVLPYLGYTIGSVSIISPVANALLLPFIPITMLFSFLTGVFGFVASFAAQPFAFISELLLKGEIAGVGFLADIPFSSFTFPPISFGVVIILYIVIIFLLSRSVRKKTIYILQKILSRVESIS